MFVTILVRYFSFNINFIAPIFSISIMYNSFSIVNFATFYCVFFSRQLSLTYIDYKIEVFLIF